MFPWGVVRQQPDPEALSHERKLSKQSAIQRGKHFLQSLFSVLELHRLVHLEFSISALSSTVCLSAERDTDLDVCDKRCVTGTDDKTEDQNPNAKAR